MKNKKLTYILLPATLLIWGVIIYKIWKASATDAFIDQGFSASELPLKTLAKDTFALLLDYRDPFRQVEKSIMTRHSSNSIGTKTTKTQDSNLWPSIVYGGTIMNQKSKKILAIVEIAGQSNFMQQGQLYNDIQLMRIYKDSIEVRLGKEKKFVRK